VVANNNTKERDSDSDVERSYGGYLGTFTALIREDFVAFGVD
jgi:hypothetical protein